MEFISAIIYSYVAHEGAAASGGHVHAHARREDTEWSGVRCGIVVGPDQTGSPTWAPSVGRSGSRARAPGRPTRQERGLDLCWGPYGGERGGDVEDRTRFRASTLAPPRPVSLYVSPRGWLVLATVIGEGTGILCDGAAVASSTKDVPCACIRW
jgi:hypothetical protein